MNMDSQFPHTSFKSNHPFASSNFYKLLENSHLLTEKTGWLPLYFSNKDSVLPSFIKDHSYGEFIFDWAWANFYHRFGVDYYPKLVHCTPFTPVNAPKVIGKIDKTLILDSFKYYQSDQKLTGEHYLFINQEEENFLKELDFKVMYTIQYHFTNKWNSFDSFLKDLKPNRRKMIKKERKKVLQLNLDISWLEDLSQQNMEIIYLLYISTIAKKSSQAYLNKDFFIGLKYNPDVKILVAKKNTQIIAMSIFFKSEDALYGRYWGIHPNLEQEYSLLHFEMCYYRGFDYIFENNIPLFEAGAQGEQKLWRGFTPVIIKSAHHLKRDDLFAAIKNYIDEQNNQTLLDIEKLKSLLPFKVTHEKA